MEKSLTHIKYTKDGVTYIRDFKATDQKLATLEAATKQATDTTAGIVELATNDETSTGVDSTRAVTPASLKHTLDPIVKKLENVTSGVTNFAYKDYTQPDNQGEMEVGIVYLVPFNKSNQFIKLDPETNAPADDQAPGVGGDTEIAYYVKCIKDSDGSVTANDKVYTQGHLENVAYTNVANTFSALNTFSSGAAFSNGITSDTLSLTSSGSVSGNFTVSGDLVAAKGIDITSGSGSTTVPNAGQVKTYVDSFIPEVRASSNSGSLVENKIYFFYDE